MEEVSGPATGDFLISDWKGEDFSLLSAAGRDWLVLGPPAAPPTGAESKLKLWSCLAPLCCRQHLEQYHAHSGLPA